MAADLHLLTVQQAAELLGCRPSTLYAKAAAGLVPRVVLWRGRRKDAIRFSLDALREHVQRNTIEPRPSKR